MKVSPIAADSPPTNSSDRGARSNQRGRPRKLLVSDGAKDVLIGPIDYWTSVESTGGGDRREKQRPSSATVARRTSPERQPHSSIIGKVDSVFALPPS
uniref:Uncharacterized protein n=1 Tax=Plectus sambesii TaxID=2011161 RepID=A0A914X092_9BILA